jgi:predicted NUDIX family NTP pyrophosphohydrolase
MKQSAGLLLFRHKGADVQVLLVHPGGPFWAKKDKGAWSIPKGEFLEGEEAVAAAKREFREELGLEPPTGNLISLESAKQSSGKMVHIWACAADLDITNMRSNTFEMEWPPKSGQQQTFPEADKAVWCTLQQAKDKLVKGQVVFIDRLAEKLDVSAPDPPQQASLFA